MVNKTRKNTTSKDDWVIAIPSYKRPETLRDKTLRVLKEFGIPSSKIHVFVADKEQEKLYRDTLVSGSYGKIIVGIVGMGAIRNFISDYFPKGKKIVNIDDDIKGFLEFDEKVKRHEKDLRSLKDTIRRGFSECDKVGARLWGVYAVPNGFFMKDAVSTDLKYIIGSFWGCINPGTKELKITLDDKEDYLRSILYYKADGAVVRLNNVSAKSSYYKEPGGMQEERTLKRVEESARWLVKEFPDYCTLNPNKKSGYMEVKLRDKTTK